MVLELLTGGELFDRIVAKGSFSEKEASELMKSITSAVTYLHSIAVVHRDLKPENLIYQSPKPDSPIKITDFGLAKYRADGGKSQMTTACGTPGYVAPEVLKNEPYGKEVDMWSLGVILYILLCGFPPFYHENTQQLYKQIKKGEYDFPDPYWTDISDSAKSLVRGLLTVDPKKRMTGKQVLAHPWITGENVSTKAFSASHTQRLKLMQARRILRRTVRSVIAVNKFSGMLRDVVDGKVKPVPSASKKDRAKDKMDTKDDTSSTKSSKAMS
jgi:calcium/calmodulin-dependent protein kinase I